MCVFIAMTLTLKVPLDCGWLFVSLKMWRLLLTAVTLFAFRAAAAAAGHEGAFKSQMKLTDCETLFVSSARNVALF